MSELALNPKPIRSQSAHPKNYKNIELHAYLDDAKIYRKYPSSHLAKLSNISLRASFKIMSYNQLKGSIKKNRIYDPPPAKYHSTSEVS